MKNHQKRDCISLSFKQTRVDTCGLDLLPKDNLTFQNIEGHVVFRLGVWRNLGLEMISDPFLLEKKQVIFVSFILPGKGIPYRSIIK